MDYSRQRYEEVDVDRLVEFPGNPNIGDEDAIEASMQANGWYGVIVTRELPSGELQILAGNHRKRAAVRQGAATVPAVILSDVDDETAVRIMLGDNEINRRGRYDHAKLTQQLQALPSLEGSGFDPEMLDRLEEFESGRAAAAQQQDEAPAKDHRVMLEKFDSAFADQFGILVEFDSEEEQQEAFERLVEDMGIDPKRMRVLSI